MHILFLTQYYPPEFGAAGIHTERIAPLLMEEGHQITLLTGLPNYPTGIVPPEYRGHFLHRETRDGVDIRRIWVYTSPSKSTKARLANQISFMFMTALRGTFLPRPDVILVESHPLFVCIAGGWLKRVKRAPVVLNVSDLWPASAVAVGALRADSRMVKVAEKVERWAYRDADHVVAMAEGQRQGIIPYVPEDKVTLIQAGTDLTRFRPKSQTQDARRAARERFGIGMDEFVIAHIGNMSLAHDFELIMDVVKAMPEQRFLFAGGGSQADYVNERVKQDKVSNLILTGILPHSDMPGLWAASDICLIAFKDHAVFEGVLPTKMFESMASGTPIVAAAGGQTRLLLEKTGAGIAVPVGDRAAMIAALRRLATSPDEYSRMSQAGPAYADEYLSPARIKRQFLDVFNRVTQRSS